MKIKKTLALICAAVLLIGVLTGCGNPADTNEPGAEQQAANGANGSITINGSTSVQPLAEELAKAFKEKNPNATIDIQGGGSGVGIKSATDGVVDIGMSSRELKTEEKSLKEFKIAIDGIAVIVNPANGVSNLTLEQVLKIYTGEITDWKDVGGNTGKITVVTREEGSGTRGAFIELTGTLKDDEDRTIASAITQGSTGAVMTTVAGDPNAIGYASFGSAKDKTEIKMISVDGKVCTEDNLNSGEYKISRPFLMLTNADPTGLSKEFLDFVMSEAGQGIVAEHGYLKSVK
ncbi:MAG TPA: phosphate ABC transporter substrate-binding protein PstS family protein [Clostridia bacterium]|nr:phosphate ABC transporter substrate-binding protein PstS family protein [Clostridia bacterium]